MYGFPAMYQPVRDDLTIWLCGMNTQRIKKWTAKTHDDGNILSVGVGLVTQERHDTPMGTYLSTSHL